tara:strand:- start:1016 stop:3049 length:2034 start_codon:yes stop_codon:yes gene_type:complete
MSKSLLEISREIPQRYVDELSTDDLRAIRDGRDEDLSLSGLQILRKGQQDLGVGELIDVGGAIAGASTGAMIGSAFGPVGTAVGGVIGGAVGTFAGEVAEDVIADREVQLGFQQGGAAREAALSAAFDTAFLGAGKAIRGYKAYRQANKSMQELGSEFQPILDAVSVAPDSPESLAQAQQFALSRGGPSLSPLATNSASMLTQIGRELGEIGIVSGRYFAEDVGKQKDIVLDAFTTFSNQALARTPEQLGQQVVQLKSGADVAMQKVYGRQLDRLKSLDTAKKYVSVAPIVNTLRKFSDQYKIDGKINFEGAVESSLLDEKASSLVNSLITNLSGSVTGRFADFRLGSIIDFEKRINDEITKMTPTGAYGNGVARRQLKDLHDEIRKTTVGIMRKADPAMAKIYQRMQKEYSEGINFLDTSTVENIVKNAFNKDAYQPLGRGLLEMNNPEKIKNLLKVAERSIITKAKTKPKMDVSSEINKFRETVRASFLKELNLVENAPVGRDKAIKNIFTESTGAVRLLDNTNAMRALFGERWPLFSKLLNHTVAMSRKRNQEVFSLAQRSAEIQAITAGTSAITGLVTGAAIGSASAALTGLAGAGLILGAPIFLYKMTSRPSLVNKYIALDNQLLAKSAESKPEQIAELMLSNLTKLISELPEEDILDIQQAVSDPNYNFGR